MNEDETISAASPMQIDAEVTAIELWGRSPHNGIWFPIHVWPVSKISADPGMWDQLEVRARYTGQIDQLNEIPSGCAASNPQDFEPLQDPNR